MQLGVFEATAKDRAWLHVVAYARGLITYIWVVHHGSRVQKSGSNDGCDHAGLRVSFCT